MANTINLNQFGSPIMPRKDINSDATQPLTSPRKRQFAQTSNTRKGGSDVLARLVSTVVDSVSDGIFVLVPRGRDFVVRDANRTLAGLMQTRIKGRYVQEVLPAEEYKRLKPLLRTLAQGCRSRCFRTSFRSLSGETHQVKLRLEPVCEGGKMQALVGTVKVLTQNVKIQKENRQLRQRFAASFEHAPYGVCFVNDQHHPFMVNGAMARMLGTEPGTLQQKNFEDLIYFEDRAVFARALQKVFEGHRSYDGIEVRMVGRDANQPLWVAMSLSLARQDKSTAPCAIVQTLDITARKENEAELLRLATRDHLTGANNRLVFDRKLKDAITNARRYSRKGAVLFIDMDDFKMVNDTFGHKAGDDVLQAVVTCASRILRETDILARLGGDEFAAILEEADPAAAEKKAQEIRAAICGLKIPLKNGNYLDVRASVGVKFFDGADADLSAENIINEADQAMYKQKGLTKTHV